MSRLSNRRFQGLIVTAVFGLALLAACSTDSPTAPVQVPPPPSDGGGGIGSGEDPFITALSPTNGSESGGTTVKITGLGMFAPLRVLFEDVPAQVVSVASNGTEVQVRTPAFAGEFETGPCTDSDGLANLRYVATPVAVVVELSTGSEATLENGFFYNPKDTACDKSGSSGG